MTTEHTPSSTGATQTEPRKISGTTGQPRPDRTPPSETGTQHGERGAAEPTPPAKASAPLTTIAAPSYADWAWIEEWNQAETVPQTMPVTKLEAMHNRLSLRMIHSTDQEIAVCLDKLFSFAAAFGISTEEAERATQFYRDALRQFPPDIVADGISTVCQTWKWGRRLPMPADLAAEMAPKMQRRRDAAAKIRLAISKAKGQQDAGTRPLPALLRDLLADGKLKPMNDQERAAATS